VCVALAKDLTKEIDRIRIERLGDRQELRDIHLTLLTFNHADNRVGPLQAGCELALRDLIADTGAFQDDGHRFGGGTAKGFHDSMRSD
jgi:hypothetical protein